MGSSPSGVAAGDFNGDGWLDAATANYDGDDVSVLINDHAWPPANAPSVSINDVTVTEGNTGSVNATFTLTLSAAYGTPITVHYATADGTATAGSDYTAASGDVTFAAGQTSSHHHRRGHRRPACRSRPRPSSSTSAPDRRVHRRRPGSGHHPRRRAADQHQRRDQEGGQRNGTTLFTFTVTLSAAYDQAVTMSFYATADGTATTGDTTTVAKTGT